MFRAAASDAPAIRRVDAGAITRAAACNPTARWRRVAALARSSPPTAVTPRRRTPSAQRPRPRELLLGHRPQVHLVRAVDQPQRARARVEARQRRVLGDAGAAVDLDRAVDDVAGGARGHDLDRRDLAPARPSRRRCRSRAPWRARAGGPGRSACATRRSRRARGPGRRAGRRTPRACARDPPSGRAPARPSRSRACSGGSGRGRGAPARSRSRRPPRRRGWRRARARPPSAARRGRAGRV